MANLDCNLSEVKNDYDALPKGDYQMMVVEDQEKTSSNSGDRYVSWTIEIISGDYKGRKFWENLNLFNTGEKAATVINMARSKVKLVAEACGLIASQVKSTSEVLNKPFLGTLDIKDDKNVLKKAAPLSSKPVTRPGL